MALKEILIKIDELQTKIDSFGKADSDVLKKINYKFRLDWNYHSNALEGNSLTREETRSVMINNITIDGKPLKDVIEVRGHDSVINEILSIGKGEVNLSESRIRNIHKGIMHEDNPEDVPKIGQWKTANNYLTNYKGERFVFLPHEEVKEKMHELINWLSSECEKVGRSAKNAMDPVIIAFKFHLDYVSIHPFYDGNGRTARIFTNLILIAFGYPPVIIKIEDKNTYNRYLADVQAYGGSPDLFYEFMGKQLIKSQELVLSAIQGEDIEEPDDLDKKLMLLEKELSTIDSDDEVKDHFDFDVFFKMYLGWISELLKKCIPEIQKFNKFFSGTNHHISIDGASQSFVNEPVDEIIEKFTKTLGSTKEQFNKYHVKFRLSTRYGTFTKGGLKTFGCNYGFEIKFEETKYSITVDTFKENINYSETFIKERLLHKPLKKEEINQLKKILVNTIYQHIDYNTKMNGIR